MENPVISVIVPIYNVEEYLNRCVESIVNQTYQNLEIILVDDGSPDNCPRMCEDWVSKDNRIKVIHKENGGLSDARNAGMKIVTGEYISFIDSDDWIDRKTFSLVMEKIIAAKAQIGAFNIISVDSDSFTPDLSDEYELLNSEQAIENTIDDTGVKTVAWNKVYHKNVLQGLTFPKGKLHEDEFFSYRALDRAERIVFLHRQCYYYFQRPTSIMGQYNVRHLDMLDGVKGRMEFVKDRYPNLYCKAKLSFSMCCLFQYEALCKHKDVDPSGEYRQKVKQLRRSVNIFKEDVKGLDKNIALYHRLTNLYNGLDIVCKMKGILKH